MVTQAVLPPYRHVGEPQEGMEPRTPQNLTLIVDSMSVSISFIGIAHLLGYETSYTYSGVRKPLPVPGCYKDHIPPIVYSTLIVYFTPRGPNSCVNWRVERDGEELRATEGSGERSYRGGAAGSGEYRMEAGDRLAGASGTGGG